jgi:hypothetical protein
MTRGTTPPAVTPLMYLELFEQHPTGRLVLDDLIARFTERAVTDGGIDAILKTYQRMGQRRVLDHIVTQINRAQGVEESNNETT